MSLPARPRSNLPDPSRKDRCLLTGATGFIGGHLAQRLAGEGYRVRCLVRTTSDTSLLETLGVEIVVGDVTSAGSLAGAVAGCGHVFHCAALVSDWATATEIARVNVQGTRNLLEASVVSSAERFIHFSTTDVYGYPGADAVDESLVPSRFRNWYSQSKRAAEVEVRRTQGSRALDTVILRPATVYGPRSREVVGEITRAMCDGNMLLIGGGRAVAGLCYVENLVDAAVIARVNTPAVGQAFNVTDGIDITWKQFTDDLADGIGCSRARWNVPYWMANGVAFSLEHGYRLLRTATGLTSRPLLSRQAVHVMGIDQRFSNRQAREVLGWEPRVDYERGLRATVEWLRDEFLAGQQTRSRSTAGA